MLKIINSLNIFSDEKRIVQHLTLDRGVPVPIVKRTNRREGKWLSYIGFEIHRLDIEISYFPFNDLFGPTKKKHSWQNTIKACTDLLQNCGSFPFTFPESAPSDCFEFGFNAGLCEGWICGSVLADIGRLSGHYRRKLFIHLIYLWNNWNWMLWGIFSVWMMWGIIFVCLQNTGFDKMYQYIFF